METGSNQVRARHDTRLTQTTCTVDFFPDLLANSSLSPSCSIEPARTFSDLRTYGPTKPPTFIGCWALDVRCWMFLTPNQVPSLAYPCHPGIPNPKTKTRSHERNLLEAANTVQHIELRQGPRNVDLRTPPGPEGSNGSLLDICRGHPGI